MEILRDLAWAACPHGGSPIQSSDANGSRLTARAGFLHERGGFGPAAGSYSEVCVASLISSLRRNASHPVMRRPRKGEQAYKLFMNARRVLSDDPELAQILAGYQWKEYAYALQLSQESVRKRPLLWRVCLLPGESHWQFNDKHQSREALRQALSAGLADPLASEAKSALGELEKG